MHVVSINLLPVEEKLCFCEIHLIRSFPANIVFLENITYAKGLLQSLVGYYCAGGTLEVLAGSGVSRFLGFLFFIRRFSGCPWLWHNQGSPSIPGQLALIFHSEKYKLEEFNSFKNKRNSIFFLTIFFFLISLHGFRMKMFSKLYISHKTQILNFNLFLRCTRLVCFYPLHMPTLMTFLVFAQKKKERVKWGMGISKQKPCSYLFCLW